MSTIYSTNEKLGLLCTYNFIRWHQKLLIKSLVTLTFLLLTLGTAAKNIKKDNAALPCVSINDITVTEGNSGTQTVYFTVTMNIPSADTVKVYYWTQGGNNTLTNANRPADYDYVYQDVVFLPGEVFKSISIIIKSDKIHEPPQDIFLHLSSYIVNATICRKVGKCTIIDNDSPPTIQIADTVISEGHLGEKIMYFKVKLIGNCSDYPIKFHVATSAGSATSDDDYRKVNGTLIIPNNKTYKWIMVAVKGDTIKENDENFYVIISNADHATIGRNQAKGTIEDDDNIDSDVRLYISDVTTEEYCCSQGDLIAKFKVGLFSASSQTVTVDYTTVDNTAQAGEDFPFQTGTLTFAPGEQLKFIDVPIINDTIYEKDESFIVKLYNPVNTTIADDIGIGVIKYNDEENRLGYVSLRNGKYPIIESDSVANISLALSNATNRTVTVKYVVESATAVAGNDFTPQTGTVTFRPYQRYQDFNIPLINDNVYELEEVFLVKITEITNALIDTISYNYGEQEVSFPNNEVFFNIQDDDKPVRSHKLFVINSPQTESTYRNIFRVELGDGPASQDISFDYYVTEGTAKEGLDYEGILSRKIIIKKGDYGATLAVRTKEDTLVEEAETLVLHLTNPVNVELIDTLVVGTILDNNYSEPYFTVIKDDGIEGKQVKVVLGFVGTTGPASVDYKLTSNTATAGLDFVAATGTIEVPAGAVSNNLQLLYFDLIDDTEVEPLENFYLELFNPVNANLVVPLKIPIYLHDNDPHITYHFDNVEVIESNEAVKTIIVPIKASASPVNVFAPRLKYDFSPNTATALVDYLPQKTYYSTWYGTDSINYLYVRIVGDTIAEGSETFTIRYGRDNIEGFENEATITIIDDDSPTFSTSTLTNQAVAPISFEAPKKTTNVFTPNGDGINDLFYLEGIEDIPNEITIINKSGRQIFNQRNYKNDWDGAGAPDGTYFYFLKTRGDDGRAVLKRGFVTVLRQQSK